MYVSLSLFLLLPVCSKTFTFTANNSSSYKDLAYSLVLLLRFFSLPTIICNLVFFIHFYLVTYPTWCIYYYWWKIKYSVPFFTFLCLFYFFKKILKNVMCCKFWSNCSVFLISTLNLSYILHLQSSRVKMGQLKWRGKNPLDQYHTMLSLQRTF